MATGKQLFLCTALLSAYSSSSMCMDTQELENKEQTEQVSTTEQKLNFDALPAHVQEQIISYLPGDNLYRTLWSRCHNASPDFYSDIAKAYLESHFVPQEYIDKAIVKNFTHFHGSDKQKREFQEKVIRTLEYSSQNDTELFSKFKKNFKHHDHFFGVSELEENTSAAFNLELRKQLRELIDSTKDECIATIQQLKNNGELSQVKKRLHKYRSFIELYRVLLPFNCNNAILNRSLSNRNIENLLHTLILLPAVIPMLSWSAFAYAYKENNGIRYVIFIMGLAGFQVTGILSNYYSRFLNIEKLDTEIAQVLDTIEQVEKA